MVFGFGSNAFHRRLAPGQRGAEKRPRNRTGLSDPQRRAALCCSALLLLAAHGAAQAATDPRVVARYQEMLAANPVEGTALERLWKIAQTEGGIERLLEEYRARGEAGDFSAQMTYGLLLRRAERPDEAMEAFERAARLDPKSPLPPLALAPALPPEKRAEELEKAANLLPPDARQLPETLEALGEAWLAAGKPEQAAQAWEKMLARAADPVTLRQRLARTYAEHGMPERALEHYRWIGEQGDPEARANAFRAQALLLESRDPAEAIGTLEKAIALTAPGHWMRADLVETAVALAGRTGQTALLEERWKAAAAAAPKSVMPWHQLATLYEKTGAQEAQRGALEKVLQLTPDDRDTQLRLARLLEGLNQIEAAAQLWDRSPPSAAQPDLVFERAELDIRLGRTDAAGQRLGALLKESKPEDADGLASRVDAFYRQHQMMEALEKHLARPEGDPVLLAEFLFSRHRPEEARQALQRLEKPDAPAALRAENLQRVSDLYKQVGRIAEAIEKLRAAVALEPQSRNLQLALGDLLLTPGGPEDGVRHVPTAADRTEARAAFTAALALSDTPAQKLEIDQRLFRSYHAAEEEPGQEAEPTLLSAAARAARKVLSVPIDAYRIAPPPARENPELQQAIRDLAQEAQKTPDLPGPKLRLARWQLWNRDYAGASATLDGIIAAAPDDAEAHRLAFEVARNRNDQQGALDQTEKLLKLVAPEEKERWEKEKAQLLFQLGKSDEALELYEALATRSGDPVAWVDLANAQQQAGRWYDALATWQRIYRTARHHRRNETLQAMVRAMLRLGMKEKVLEILWSAYEEKSDEATLNELITQSQEQNAMPKLIDRLKARAEASGTAEDRFALGYALKADGQEQAALAQWEGAASEGGDRPALEERLVKEAEALHDLRTAAQHQARRVEALRDAPAQERVKLAMLQAAALDERAALASVEEIIRRFPRDADALLPLARALVDWGEPGRALAIAADLHRNDPANVAASILLLRLLNETPPAPGREVAGQRGEVAEALLKYSGTRGSREENALILPPAPAVVGNRLRAVFSTLNGPAARLGHRDARTVELYNERLPGASERDWRLEAICTLALQQTTPQARAAWVARWQEARATPSEKLWAYYYAGAREQTVTLLRGLQAQSPRHPALRAALVWTLLDLEEWKTLADWLWRPERTHEDHDGFRLILREWALLHRPLEIDALFGKAPVAWVQPCAEMLATQGRFADAVALGEPIFETLPPPRGAFGLPLATWMFTLGRTEDGEAILQQIAHEPGETPGDPAYAAQRLLYLLLPEAKRERWRAQFLKQTAEANLSPLHTALTTALLGALASDAKGMEAGIDQLVALRAGLPGEAPVLDRIWRFLLETGTQFRNWNLDRAALLLWEKALEDEASIRLQGHQAIAYADEIRARIAMLELRPLAPHDASRRIAEWSGEWPVARLNQLASVLEATGESRAAIEVFNAVEEREKLNLSTRLLSSALTSKNLAAARTIVERWLKNPEVDTSSAPAILEFLATYDLPKALETVRLLAPKTEGDQRLLEVRARLCVQSEAWEEAQEAYRKLTTLQPGNPSFTIGLARTLLATGRKEEALTLLKTSPRREGVSEVERASLFIEAGIPSQARQIGWELAQGNHAQHAMTVAKALYDHGEKEDALILVNGAIRIASDGQKNRQAFELQADALRWVEPGQPVGARWVKRLRRLADRPELLSSYYELTLKPGWLAPGERLAQLRRDWKKGDPAAGIWLVDTLLNEGKAAEARTIAQTLLSRDETPVALFRWLNRRFESVGEHGMALEAVRKALERQPGDLPLLLSATSALQALGRNDEASALLEFLRPLSLTKQNWSGPLALAAEKIGNPALARRFFEQAVKADPAGEKTEIQLHYARLLLDEGNFPGAKRLLRQAYQYPGVDDPALIIDYLRRIRRTAPPELESELRDLGLSDEMVQAVRGELAPIAVDHPHP
ncbi:MAG TPA: tetratricopeptide repeat protein [Chthoniobacteraceae bacterium]|nr:tetratricopeptide repeat protein [Chthoniobacteraceae bacterium]